MAPTEKRVEQISIIKHIQRRFWDHIAAAAAHSIAGTTAPPPYSSSSSTGGSSKTSWQNLLRVKFGDSTTTTLMRFERVSSSHTTSRRSAHTLNGGGASVCVFSSHANRHAGVRRCVQTQQRTSNRGASVYVCVCVFINSRHIQRNGEPLPIHRGDRTISTPFTLRTPPYPNKTKRVRYVPFFFITKTSTKTLGKAKGTGRARGCGLREQLLLECVRSSRSVHTHRPESLLTLTTHPS